MNKKIFSRLAMIVALSGGLTSCNYLDVTPDEKIALDDVIKTQDHFLNYLNSCYGGVKKMNYWDTTTYTQSTDEHLNPLLWGTNDGGVACACDMLTGGLDWNAYNKKMPIWADCYDYIGQCHLFEKEIASHPLPENVTQNDVDIALEETNFLKAFYYFRLLENFGPIPILDGYFDMDTPSDQIPGRRHFDYCVDYIVAQCDRAIASPLIPMKWEANFWGRITKPIAAALKSRVTLLAASPLWSGDFPFPNWKNEDLLGGNDFCPDYDEKYGYEIVPYPSASEKTARWERAKKAAEEAISIAKQVGHDLMDVENAYSLLSSQENQYIKGQLELLYVPGVTERYQEKLANGTAAGSEEEMFLKRVCLYKYLPNSYAVIPNDPGVGAAVAGNIELIWGTILDGDDSGNLKRRGRLCPVRTSYYQNNWIPGQGANAPTLYSAEHFWTENGVLPRHDSEWSGMSMQEAADDATYDAWALERAGITTKWREDIVNLYVGREPRFYANISFDGGNFALCPNFKNGKYPLILDMKVGSGREGDNTTRNSEKPVGNGYVGGNDGAFTGFYNGKWTKLDQINGASSTAADPNIVDYPMPIFRVAELYLNLAEACAALNDVGGVQNALQPIRERALGAEHAAIPSNLIFDQNMYNHEDGDGFGLMEWVRNERFIELWDESHRYFDLRRWKMGPERLAAGKRNALKITVGYQNPASDIGGISTFDSDEAKEFNFRYFKQRTILEGMPYTWTDRMYIAPIWDDEVYAAPKLVQAPNY